MLTVYDKFMLYGILFIFSGGLILMMIRKSKARNSDQARDALKYGTIYTTLFIVVYCIIFSILYKLIAN